MILLPSKDDTKKLLFLFSRKALLNFFNNLGATINIFTPELKDILVLPIYHFRNMFIDLESISEEKFEISHTRDLIIRDSDYLDILYSLLSLVEHEIDSIIYGSTNHESKNHESVIHESKEHESTIHESVIHWILDNNMREYDIFNLGINNGLFSNILFLKLREYNIINNSINNGASTLGFDLFNLSNNIKLDQDINLDIDNLSIFKKIILLYMLDYILYNYLDININIYDHDSNIYSKEYLSNIITRYLNTLYNIESININSVYSKKSSEQYKDSLLYNLLRSLNTILRWEDLHIVLRDQYIYDLEIHKILENNNMNEVKKGRQKKLPKKSEIYEYIKEEVPNELLEYKGFEEAWIDFVSARADEIRKPLTKRAAKRMLNRIMAFVKEGQDPAAVLERSIRNGWQDVYPIKENSFALNKNNNLSKSTFRF